MDTHTVLFKAKQHVRQTAARIKGASLVEYSMAAALVSILSIGAVAHTGGSTREILCHASEGIKSGMRSTGLLDMGPGAYCAGILTADTGLPPALPGDSGGGEGVGGGEVPADGGTDAGGGQSAQPGSPQEPATTPRATLSAFKDYTFQPGRGTAYTGVAYARIAPAESFTFTVAYTGTDPMPGELALCPAYRCTASSPTTVQSMVFADSTDFAPGYRFKPTVSLLEPFSVPLRLTLTSTTDPSKTWVQDITITRGESSLGMADIDIPDFTMAPGATANSRIPTPINVAGPDQARWRLTISPTSAPENQGQLDLRYLMAQEAWTSAGPIVQEFATTDTNRVYLYMARLLTDDTKYSALSRAFEARLESLEDPNVSSTDTFTIRRPETAIDAPKLTVANMDVAAGKVGAHDFPITISGNGGKVFLVEAIADDAGNIGPAPTIKSTTPSTSGAQAMPLSLAETVTRANMTLTLPQGASVLEDSVWHYRAHIQSSLEPEKASVAEFSISRPAATFAIDMNLADIAIPEMAINQNFDTKQDADTTQKLRFTAKAAAPVPSNITNMITLQACFNTTACNTINLGNANPVSPTYTAPKSFGLRAMMGNNINFDAYAEIDIPVDVTLALDADPTNTVQQQVRVFKPAAVPFAPEITVPATTNVAASGPIYIPFEYRYTDKMMVAIENAPSGYSTSVSPEPNATTGGYTFIGAWTDNIPTTKQGTIILTPNPNTSQAIDATLRLKISPYGPGRSYTSLPSITTPFSVKRNDLPRLSFTTPPPGTLNTDPTTTIMKTATFDFAPAPEGSRLSVYLQEGSSQPRYANMRVCGQNLCTRWVGWGQVPATYIDGVEGPLWIEYRRSSATTAPTGNFYITPYYTGTNLNYYGTRYTTEIR